MTCDFVQMMDVQERIEHITVRGRKWNEICFKYDWPNYAII